MIIVKMKWSKLSSNSSILSSLSDACYVKLSDIQKISETDGDKKCYFITSNDNSSNKYDFSLVNVDTNFMCIARVILDSPIVTNKDLLDVVYKIFTGNLDNPMRTAVKVCRL